MAKKPIKKVAKKPAAKPAAKKAVKKPAAKIAMKAKPAKIAKAPAPKKVVPVEKAAPAPIQKWKVAVKPKNGTTLSYTQSEFFENIKGFCGLRKRAEAKLVCEDIARFVKDSLKKGYKIPLMGLGKLYVRQSKARTGRNPATGETIQIPARKRVRFVATKALKDAVL